MSDNSLLRDHLGPSIAKALAAAVFQVPVISNPLIDFLKQRLKNDEEAGQAERQIGYLVDQCLAPLESRFAARKGFNRQAVAVLLSESVERHIDAKALARGDLNRLLVHNIVLEARPLEDLKREAYSPADIEAYSMAMPIIIDKLIDTASKLKGFEIATNSEILGRLTKLGQEAEALRSGIETLQKRFDNIIRFKDKEGQAYATDYCDHINKHLNAVQLFGITTEAVASQQKLSTAFIPLSLAHDRSAKNKAGSIYFSSLLARLTPETPRLLITGPAGSGKTTLLKWAAIQAAEMIALGLQKVADWNIGDRPEFAIKMLANAPRHEPETANRTVFSDEAVNLHPVENQLEAGIHDSNRRHVKKDKIENKWWLRVPFFIPLRYCEGGSLPTLDVYPKIGTDFHLDPPLRWVQSILTAGRGLVLIDGIDEIPESDRLHIRRALEGFCRLEKGNYVVFTTRPSVVDDSWFFNTSMMRAEINPLMDTERAELIQRWHVAAAEQLALVKRPDDATPLTSVLIEKLAGAPHIAQLGSNPLLCAAICALHYNRKGYLPNDQSDLCQELCQLLIHRRDEERGLLDEGRETDYGQLDYKQKEALIRDLAQTSLRTGGVALEPAEVEARIFNKLPALKLASLDPSGIRRGLVKRTGLLREAYGGAIDFATTRFGTFWQEKRLRQNRLDIRSYCCTLRMRLGVVQ